MCTPGRLCQWLSGKESTCNAGDIGDVGLVLESRRTPAGGNDNLRPYTCLKNLTGREAWQAKVHGVAKETGQYP